MKKKLLLFNFIFFSIQFSPVSSQTGSGIVLLCATNMVWMGANTCVVSGAAVTNQDGVLSKETYLITTSCANKFYGNS